MYRTMPIVPNLGFSVISFDGFLPNYSIIVYDNLIQYIEMLGKN